LLPICSFAPCLLATIKMLPPVSTSLSFHSIYLKPYQTMSKQNANWWDSETSKKLQVSSNKGGLVPNQRYNRDSSESETRAVASKKQKQKRGSSVWENTKSSTSSQEVLLNRCSRCSRRQIFHPCCRFYLHFCLFVQVLSMLLSFHGMKELLHTGALPCGFGAYLIRPSMPHGSPTSPFSLSSCRCCTASTSNIRSK
jgi:hypothetical protein